MHPSPIGMAEQVKTALALWESERRFFHCLAEKLTKRAAIIETEDRSAEVPLAIRDSGVGVAPATRLHRRLSRVHLTKFLPHYRRKMDSDRITVFRLSQIEH